MHGAKEKSKDHGRTVACMYGSHGEVYGHPGHCACRVGAGSALSWGRPLGFGIQALCTVSSDFIDFRGTMTYRQVHGTRPRPIPQRGLIGMLP